MIAGSNTPKRAISFQTHHLQDPDPVSAGNGPDRGGRLAILHRHAPPGLAEAPRRLAQLAARTAGWSGAELAALCRAAGVAAIKRAVAAAQPPGAVRVQRDDVQIALAASAGVAGVPTDVCG